MKNINKYLCFVVMTILFVGCYEDKGNYDYKDIHQLQINLNTGQIKAAIGDPILIKPIITFENGKGDMSRLEYRWSLKDYTQDDWNTLEFNWIASKQCKPSDLILTVTDKVTGIVYMDKVTCEVSSEYNQNSWLVLSDNGGKSQLSYFKILNEGVTPEGHPYFNSVIPYEDVYKKENKDELGTSPLKIILHFCNDRETIGQQLILQKDRNIDLGGLTMEKDIDFKEAFVGKEYPEGVEIKDARFMTQLDVVADQHGKLYSRVRLTPNLFHSSYFLPEPLKHKGEELKDCRLVFGRYSDVKYTLIYDNNKKRLLVIMDAGVGSGSSLVGAGEIVNVPAMPTSTVGLDPRFVPLNNLSGYEVLHIGYYRVSRTNLGYSMILKGVGGKYYLQQFEIRRTSGTKLDLQKCRFAEIKGLTQDPTLIYVPPYRSKVSNILIGVDNSLYLFDTADVGSDILLYKEFEAPMRAIDGEVYESRQVGVGLENGNFYILNMCEAHNLPDNKKVLYSLPENIRLGKIVDVKRKLINKGQAW